LVLQKFWKRISWKTKKVLQPCRLDEITCLDLDYLKNLIEKDYLTPSRIEYYQSTSTKNYNLEDGFMEFLVNKATNGQRVADGHSPLDIINQQMGIGIDVACLCLNGNWSNEKSIIQNFKNAGNDLDNLFQSNMFNEAIKIYQKCLFNKLFMSKHKYQVSDLYYLVFVSIKNQIYLMSFKLIIENIFNIRQNGYTDSMKSIRIKNFINPKLGKTILYKSKKRIEIRFSKDAIKHFNSLRIV